MIGAPVIDGEIAAAWDARGGPGVVNGAGGLMALMDACTDVRWCMSAEGLREPSYQWLAFFGAVRDNY